MKNGATTGDQNVAIGESSCQALTSGTRNTCVGRASGFSLNSGSNNTFLGWQAGQSVSMTTGSNNTLVGYNVSCSAAADTNEIVIGTNGEAGKGSSTGFINAGSGSIYQGNNSTLWAVTSDERIKKNIVDNNTGLDVIQQIQVRNFEYRLPEEITELPQNQAVAKTGVQLGVIAQELAQVLPECVKTESTGVMTVDADNLTWYLINAVKELSAEVQSLKQQLGAK
jgi:hypothetical protein